MNNFTKVLTATLEKFLILLMASIVIDVTWQIATRFLIGKPSSFTEELAGFLLMWIGLLGGSYAYYKRAHLGIDIITSRFQGRKKALSELLISLIVFLFAFFILFIGGIRMVTITFTLKQISPSLTISMGYIYLVLPLSGSIMMYYAFTFFIEAFKKVRTRIQAS